MLTRSEYEKEIPMCYASPGPRCLVHAQDRYFRLLNLGPTSDQARLDLVKAEHDYDLVVINKAGLARANVQYYLDHEEELENLNARDRAKYDRDVRLISRYAELKQQRTPEQLQELRQESTDRHNIAHYLSSADNHPTRLNTPENNEEIVRMFDLLTSTPAGSGGRPLTDEEQKVYEDAKTRLAAGQVSTDHSERDGIDMKGQPRKPSGSPALPSFLKDPEKLAELREQQRQALRLTADEPAPTPTETEPEPASSSAETTEPAPTSSKAKPTDGESFTRRLTRTLGRFAGRGVRNAANATDWGLYYTNEIGQAVIAHTTNNGTRFADTTVGKPKWDIALLPELPPRSTEKGAKPSDQGKYDEFGNAERPKD
jgi:hypothetical protein